jgi:hypothetical protein
VINWDRHTIKGTSTTIEKSYLRLTSVSYPCPAVHAASNLTKMPSILLCLSMTQAPNPANIRPLHILEKTLVHIKNKWKLEEKPYPWICDQLKSMRQDLTVSPIDLADSDESLAE